ncbi:MAG: DUF1579 family protein, partial [Phycisphaerae bacterium]
MKTNSKGLWIVCAAIAVGVAFKSAISQQADAQQPPNAAQMQEMMDKWMKTTEAGPQHEFLQKTVGEWDTVTRMWWAGPGSEPIETKGTSSVKSIHGGRFVMEEHKGKMPMPAADGTMKGIDYSGLGITGYDRYRNLYTGIWTN